jgi:hypothetical protein
LLVPAQPRPAAGAALLASIVLSLVVAGCTQRRPTAATSLSLEYTVHALSPASGIVAVELLLRNLPAGRHELERGGNARTTTLLDLEAQAGQRKVELVRAGGAADRWTLIKGEEPEVRVRWRARQGGLDRHGHEGYLGPSFGMVDGGVYLVLRSALAAEARSPRGATPVSRVRVRVLAPSSWQVVSSMRTAEDGLLDPAIDGRWPVTHLAHSNTALGAFDATARRIGDVRLVLQVYRPWPARKKAELAARVFRIYETFQRQTPSRGLGDSTVIALPAAPDGEPVTGQFWSTGQAFSYDAYANRPRRFWELLAHRMAHAVNRYAVCGLRIDDPMERWFVEGWASWTEATHTRDVLGNEQRLVELGKTYRAAFFGLGGEARDEPVVAEATHRASQQRHFLHYVKAPLVVASLDYALRRASGGKKTVNGLMTHLHAKYSGLRGNVPLRAELRAYAGTDFAPFFAENVQQAGFLYPVHPDFLAHLRRQPVPQGPVALRVNGLALGARQHARLVRLLQMIKAEDATAVRERLVQLLLVFGEYERRGLDAIPPEMIELADRLPASVRLLLFRHQARLLFGAEERLAAWTKAQRATARVEVLPTTQP